MIRYIRKKISSLFLLALLIATSHLSAEVALPQWNEADKEKLKAGKIIVGEALFSSPSTSSENTDTPLEVTPQAVPVPVERLLTENELKPYYTLHASGVIDPQGILTTHEKSDIAYLLSEHQSQSPLPIYLYILDEKQKLPRSFLLDVFYSNVFNEKPAAIVFYFMNEPSRTLSYVASNSKSTAQKGEIRDMLAQSAKIAYEKTNSLDQMEDFLGQISMRLYWIEQRLIDLKPIIQSEKKETKKQPSPSAVDKLQSTWQDYVGEYTLLVIAGITLIISCLLGLFLYSKFRKYRFAYIPPNTHRLGAPHGAAIGEPMCYKHINNPPSEQKKKLREKITL